jgi:hypothetical protein
MESMNANRSCNLGVGDMGPPVEWGSIKDWAAGIHAVSKQQVPHRAGARFGTTKLMYFGMTKLMYNDNASRTMGIGERW